MRQFKEAAGELAVMIQRSVEAAVGAEEVAAVAYSGGLDSSIVAVCAKKRAMVVAVSAFAEGSLDSKAAVLGAEEIGVESSSVVLGPEEVQRGRAEVEVPFEPSPMDRDIWCLYSAVARRASEKGARVLLLGQLADELFGGYSKYAEALGRGGEAEAGRAMAEDLAEYPARGRVRDVAACSRWVDPRFPFEAAEVVEFAASVPMEYKIRDGARKVVLREAALVLGVPQRIVALPKKAAQYSSGIRKISG